MSGVEAFLDTNVLVYAFLEEEPVKQGKARELLLRPKAMTTLVVSSQVVQEFVAVGLRKFKKTMKPEDMRDFLDQMLLPLCRIWSSADFYREALATQTATGLSWHDSLILQGALECRAPKLYSEDLQEGYRYRSVTVVNPFR